MGDNCVYSSCILLIIFLIINYLLLLLLLALTIMNAPPVPSDTQQLPFISLGVSIRHVTSYLLDDYAQTIRSLSTQPLPETKRQQLIKLIKTLNEKIRSLIRFIKNSKKHEKIFKIYQRRFLLSTYFTNVHLINDRLHSLNEVCNFYRTPSFQITKSIQVLHLQAHNNLKKAIFEWLVQTPDFAYAPKEQQFNFIEKYCYTKDLNKSYTVNDGVISNNMCLLNIPSLLCLFKHSEDESVVYFKDNMFYIGYYELFLFKLVPQIYNDKMTFLCKEIKYKHNHPAFVHNEQIAELNKKLSLLNPILQEQVVIDVVKQQQEEKEQNDKMDIDDDITNNNNNDNSDNSDGSIIDLHLHQVKHILSEFIKEHIFTFIFDYYKYKISKYLSSFSKPIRLSITNNNGVPSINIEYKPDPSITPLHLKDNFILTITPLYANATILFKASQHVVSYLPFIYIDTYEECFHIKKPFPYQNLISTTLNTFQDIFLYEIYSKLIQIESMFIDMKFIISNRSKLNNKIDCIIPNHNNMVLFSICLNLKGEINIIDYDSVFNYNESEIIKRYIVDYIKQGNNSLNVVEYNEFIYKTYIKTLFSFSRTQITFNKDMNSCNYVFTFTNPKYAMYKYNNKITLHTSFNNKLFYIKHAYFSICDTKNENITHDMTSYVLTGFPNRTFVSSQRKGIEYILHKITRYYDINDEAIRNMHDMLSVINISKLSSHNLFLENTETHLVTISFMGDNLKEILAIACENNNNDRELGERIISHVDLINENSFCKIYLNKNELDKLFNYIPLHGYSIFLNKYHSHFDSNSEQYCLTNYILTKLGKPNTNPIRNILISSIQKFIQFIKQISIQVKLLLDNNKFNFRNNCTLFVSPIYLQFRFDDNAILSLMFKNNDEKCNWVYKAFSRRSLFKELNNDLDRELLSIKNDGQDVERYAKYFFIIEVYEIFASLITTYPSEYNSNCAVDNDNITENYDKQLFLLFKDHKTFEIYLNEYYMIIIEVQSIERVRIMFYSIIRYDKCTELMNVLCNIPFKCCNWKLNGETWELFLMSSDKKDILEDLKSIVQKITNHESVINNSYKSIH